MLETLNCNSCGAPIEVAGSAKFFRCNHCNTNLQVRRTSGATFTESVDRLADTTEKLSGQVEKLTKQGELEALDREWEFERESFMIQDKRGNRHVPSGNGAMIGAFTVAGFGLLWTIMAVSITQLAPNFGPFAIAKVIFPLFGVGFIVFAIFGGISTKQKATQFRSAEREYQRKRIDLIDDDRRD